VKQHCEDIVCGVVDADADCDLDVMNAVNPNLAMTNCLLETECEGDAAMEVYCDELNQTVDVEPEVYVWDENDIDESEPIVSSDYGQSLQLSAASHQSQHTSAINTVSPKALVVTCTTKLVPCQQPTIIVTHACRPTSCSSSSPVVARVSKAGILSKVKPATVTIDGSSGLIFKNTVVAENCSG